MAELYGFDEFEKKMLELLEKEYPKEIEDELIRIAEKLKTDVKLRTRVDKGELRRSIDRVDPKQVNDGYQIEVGTNKDYAEPQEFGFRTKNGGFVKGTHMFETSIEDLLEDLPKELNRWVEKLLKELKV